MEDKHNTIYVGIDWDRKKSIACAIDNKGRVRTYRKPLRPTIESARAFVETIRRWHPEATCVRLAIESGSRRWVRLFLAAGALVHVIDGKRARRFAESLSASGAKAAHRDARMLLELARSPAHRRTPYVPPGPDQASLLHLVRLHRRLTEHHTRIQNRLRAHMSEHLPALDEVLTDLDAGWLVRLLRVAPTPGAFAALDRAGFERLLKGSRMHRTTKEKVWAAMTREAVLLDPVEAEMVAFTVGLELDQLVQVRAQIAQVDQRLTERLAADARGVVLRSVQGGGLHIGAGLLALCFGPGVPSHRDAAARQLGASPVTRRTGQQKKPSVRLRRSASSLGRHLAYLLGLQAVRYLGWARAMYQDGRRRGQTVGTAFRRVARSLLRILTAMVRAGEAYDDARYVCALKKKGVPWAQDLSLPAAA